MKAPTASRVPPRARTTLDRRPSPVRRQQWLRFTRQPSPAPAVRRFRPRQRKSGMFHLAPGSIAGQLATTARRSHPAVQPAAQGSDLHTRWPRRRGKGKLRFRADQVLCCAWCRSGWQACGFRSSEQPVLALQTDRADRVFDGAVVDREAAHHHRPRSSRPPLQGVLEGTC